MPILEFINRHGLAPEQVDAKQSLDLLLHQMELGLSGRGNIPMIPSYLSPDTKAKANMPVCVMDAGGTNLRFARAEFAPDGSCTLSNLRKVPMPGTEQALSCEEFYATLAAYARQTGCPEQIGLCFSYNVLLERDLDGILESWCKEVKVPDAPGKKVGASLQKALGPECRSVRVLNDSTAALLGSLGSTPELDLGLILGTGINICYCEPCSRIPKVPTDLNQRSMIISTEIGEFDGFPKSTFDKMVIATSDQPDLAHAEKQCAGAYLGDLICLAWQAAAKEGLIPQAFAAPVPLPVISDYLAGSSALPEDDGARAIAATMICRAAKLAAILTAGAVLRCRKRGESCGIVIEGSQFYKLTGFGPAFTRELDALLAPHAITAHLHQVENSCLLGAAMAAFARPM